LLEEMNIVKAETPLPAVKKDEKKKEEKQKEM
jgi:hypothetical protein